MPTIKRERTGSILKGALGGGMTGFAAAGPWGLLGAIPGAILGGLEKSDEEILQERLDRFLLKLREKKAKTLTEGKEAIGQQIGTAVGTVKAGAARKAAGTGRIADVESYTLPGEQMVYQQGSQVLKDFLLQTNRAFDAAELEAELGFAQRPLQTPVADYLLGMGEGAMNIKQSQDIINILTGQTQIPGLGATAPALRTYTPAKPSSFDIRSYLRETFPPRTMVPLARG
jgi:hypothetical protein